MFIEFCKQVIHTYMSTYSVQPSYVSDWHLSLLRPVFVSFYSLYEQEQRRIEKEGKKEARTVFFGKLFAGPNGIGIKGWTRVQD